MDRPTKALLCFFFCLMATHHTEAQWSTPVRLQGPINSDPSSKSWPSINATEDTIYYAKLGANGQENICYSYRVNDSLWSAPIFMPPWINSPDQRDISPSIGPGDSTLYWVTYERPGGYGSYDIWFTRRDSTGQWMEPENAGPNINSAGMEWGVYLSRSGEALYFSSTRLNNGNGLDILESQWTGSGWGPAESLPGNFNYISDEQNVTLPADESWLVLTMEWYAASRVDLWETTRTDSGWPRPQLIPGVNSNANEDGASLSPNGNTLYLASARNDSTGFRQELFVSRQSSAVKPRSLRGPAPPKSIIYPNPYGGGKLQLLPSRLFEYGSISLSIFNVLGQQMDLGSSEIRNPSVPLIWNIQKLTPGTYFVRLSTSRESEIVRFTILR